MIGIDVETTALWPAEGDLRLLQLSDGRKVKVYDAFRQDKDLIRRAVEKNDELVAHNAPFERRWINAALDLDRPDLQDTMVMSQVYYTGTRASLGGNFSHSLQAVAKRELKRELSKDEQTSDWAAVALSREQLVYAARDAHVMPRLAETLMRKIEKAGLTKVYELERRLSHAVDAMERRGVAVHREQLEVITAEATEQAERLKAELTERWWINPGSSKQLIEKFKLNERKDWPKTKSGKGFATNKDAMERLIGEIPEMPTWFEWKAVDKIRSTYGKSFLDRITSEGRIHGRFNSFGAATGRLSSSQPNLQNIPKRGERGARARSVFWSGADDRVLIKADYASIELWVAAVLWDDPHMQHALQQGLNMHVATAAALFNVKLGDVTKEQNSRTHHERFPGLDRASKHCSGFFSRQPAKVSKCK
jgi:DNA polymerase I